MFELGKKTVSEFNEFQPRLKSAKNRFQLNAGLNIEKPNTILSGTMLLRSYSENRNKKFQIQGGRMFPRPPPCVRLCWCIMSRKSQQKVETIKVIFSSMKPSD